MDMCPPFFNNTALSNDKRSNSRRYYAWRLVYSINSAPYNRQIEFDNKRQPIKWLSFFLFNAFHIQPQLHTKNKFITKEPQTNLLFYDRKHIRKEASI